MSILRLTAPLVILGVTGYLFGTMIVWDKGMEPKYVIGKTFSEFVMTPPEPPKPIVQKKQPVKKKKVNVSESEQYCLARAIWFEARGEPYQGKQAVANVIFNRIKNDDSDMYPETICRTVYQGCQFSWNCDPEVRHIKPEKLNDPIAKESWQYIYSLAKEWFVAYNTDKMDDVTSGAQFFLNEDLVSSKPKWARVFVKTADIGNHSFYRKN